MNVQLKAITDIKPYARNPRKKKNLDKVVQSIKQFGWQQPIVVDRAGVIVAGHSRYEAAKILECKEIPVLIAKAYRIADNKTNEFSEWDFSLLNKEFTDLLDINMDLEITGFDTKELEDFFTFDKEDDVAKIKTEKSCPNCGTKLK
jgi:ParB family transcriptional regulator, chromosome partitioning protein